MSKDGGFGRCLKCHGFGYEHRSTGLCNHLKVAVMQPIFSTIGAVRCLPWTALDLQVLSSMLVM